MSEIKLVSDLLGMNFFVPSYQRGYRWDKQQIEDLLNDIDNFAIKYSEKEFYCLQPIVVKQLNKEEKEKNNLYSEFDNNEWYEVIDGQQRLTTIFLIIHYFNEMWVGKQKFKEPIIKYETRNDSYEFLKQMEVENDNVKINDSYIDYKHISIAYQAIHNWAKRKGDFDYDKFKSRFRENTKIIWYEIDHTKDGRDIFSRINMGKIPLTNAELIKALFLNKSNFKTENKDEDEQIRLKQLEIATEWDYIETTLRNDEFWLFINEMENQKENRIELLFELLVEKNEDLEDNYFTFRKYYEKFINEKDISDNWQKVKRYFQTLYDWFENRELYHKIGFLITFHEKIKDLIELSLSKDKNVFVDSINEKIASICSEIPINDLEYEDKEKVKKILLLHNILTMLNNKKENSRFPFNRFKEEKWDIEHIHAIATEIPKERQNDWLQQAREFIKEDKSLIKRIGDYSKEDPKEIFESLFKDILNYFDEKKEHKDINDLSNLVLLDAGTNRAYKNAVFPVKRKTIIKREKEGTFVPICTKNVFMKYYSPQIEGMDFWGEKDKDEYFKDIEEILKKNNYLPIQKEEL